MADRVTLTRLGWPPEMYSALPQEAEFWVKAILINFEFPAKNMPPPLADELPVKVPLYRAAEALLYMPPPRRLA